MTSIFGKAKTPDMPEPEKIEETQTIKDDASEAQKREKRRVLLEGGRRSNMLAGLRNALKKRLGE